MALNRKDLRTRDSGVRLEHRHFAFIAGVIDGIDDPVAKVSAALSFAKACARTNPRFDRLRFLAACGMPEKLVVVPLSSGGAE